MGSVVIQSEVSQSNEKNRSLIRGFVFESQLWGDTELFDDFINGAKKHHMKLEKLKLTNPKFETDDYHILCTYSYEGNIDLLSKKFDNKVKPERIYFEEKPYKTVTLSLDVFVESGVEKEKHEAERIQRILNNTKDNLSYYNSVIQKHNDFLDEKKKFVGGVLQRLEDGVL